MLRYALASLAAASAVAHAEPDRAQVYDELDAPVFIAGAIVFGSSYTASAIAATANHPGAQHLLMPLVGPWLAARDWGRCSDAACSRDKGLLVGDGALQLLGMLAMLEALIWPSHHRVITRIAGFELVPSGAGVAVVGGF